MFAGYEFKDKSLYDLARTHTSFANEQKTNRDLTNQRLEFLGDSILGFITGEYLYNNYPNLPEGELTKIRAEVVCEKSLYEIAKSLNLGECLLLGKGEEQCGGRERISNLADAVEAMLGAVYEDSDIDTVRRVLLPLIADKIKFAAKWDGKHDYKTTLQEYVQRKKGSHISYSVINESGPDHMRIYTTQVCIDGKVMGIGEGRSKKASEQSAARCALESMESTVNSGEGNKNETL